MDNSMTFYRKFGYEYKIMRLNLKRKASLHVRSACDETSCCYHYYYYIKMIFAFLSRYKKSLSIYHYIMHFKILNIYSKVKL